MKYLQSNPSIIGGAFAIKGTRIGNTLVLHKLAASETIADINKEWPWLPEATLRGAITEAIEHFDVVTRAPSGGAVWLTELRERLIFDHDTEYEIVASPELLTEYVETIHRPELFTHYTSHAVQALFEYLSHADILELKNIPSVSRDSADDMVIATAVRGGANYLVLKTRTFSTYNG